MNELTVRVYNNIIFFTGIICYDAVLLSEQKDQVNNIL